MANKKEDLDSEAYQTALANLQRMSREEGIDRVMNEHNLDAIVAPTETLHGVPTGLTEIIIMWKFISSSLGGLPNITVPMGDIHGLPVGLSFFGRAWRNPL